MVSVAQLVEPRVVIPVVVGSSPIVHPMFSIIQNVIKVLTQVEDNAFWNKKSHISLRSILSLYNNGLLFDNSTLFAKVAELVDALDLGSSGVTRESSSLSFRTIS
ncbi:Protein of unknown function [Legionella hackeliae]|uniref:Uncharacterized protein n=1 Tax=Legionella hackeliae TaxID=449 RepID=A0A0A8UQJ6_LEGHA|nr:hypothetical protein Lhac_2666 [Legionella hackeliae]CEK09796.1 Protein of unknown function [Legionella hackeliae]